MTIGCHDLDPGWTDCGYVCAAELGYIIIPASVDIIGQSTSGCFSGYIKGFVNLSAVSGINAVGG